MGKKQEFRVSNLGIHLTTQVSSCELAYTFAERLPFFVDFRVLHDTHVFLGSSLDQ